MARVIASVAATQGTFITTRSTITAEGAATPACVAETVTLVVGEEQS